LSVCKYCHSKHVIKYGSYKGIQRYYCRDCSRKFVAVNTIPKMKHSAEIIAESLYMHFEGRSFNEIRCEFIRRYGKFISKVTPYNWQKRFSPLAQKESEKYKPICSDVWECRETVIRRNFGGDGQRLFMIMILDRDTRFLLATRLTVNRSKIDIRTIFEQARGKAEKLPRRILTNGWEGYEDGIELAYGSEANFIKVSRFKPVSSFINTAELWKKTLKGLTKNMQELKSYESMNYFLNNWVIHYNFFNYKFSLEGKTPAKMAGIEFPYANWKELIEKQPYNVTARIPIKPKIQ
jgi:transposase-like protein